ncbi:hypothetical protein R1sor_012218 [Riccia sorocarpa]|uniref:Alpha N-terminal protein methyltransferase 1 n=1 Tax=Riccia sorocarpa TaxID=122646 RepID=A0ABD3I746_9MARC
MAGIPASAFQNPATNALKDFNTPEVAPGAINSVTMANEAKRRRVVLDSFISGSSSVANEDGDEPVITALVTEEECGDAELRNAKVLQLAVGQGGPPQWFGQAVQQAVQQGGQPQWFAQAFQQAVGQNGPPQWFAQAVQQAVQQGGPPQWFPQAFQQAVQPLRGEVQQGFRGIQAQFDNLWVFKHNTDMFARMQAGHLIAPNKTVTGFAQAVPIPAMDHGDLSPDIAAIFDAQAPLPGVGVRPPPAIRFPGHVHDNLTQAEIGILARWYNDTFGIVAGDLHPIQLQKLTGFLMGFLRGPLNEMGICLCFHVDLVEPVQQLIEVAQQDLHLDFDSLGTRMRKVNFLNCPLQEYVPPAERYDVIWIQWCIGHLTDADVMEFFNRAKLGLKRGGFIVLKENIAKSRFVLDKEDFSVTRSDQYFRDLFQQGGLHVYQHRKQTGFPRELFEVHMYCLTTELKKLTTKIGKAKKVNRPGIIK